MPKCTYCGGIDFLEGPSGGMSTNILCANPECRHWFNHTPILGRLDDLNRVEPTTEERNKAAEDLKTKNEAATTSRLQEGRDCYISGKLPDRRFTNFTDLDCLIGYIEAMAEEI